MFWASMLGDVTKVLRLFSLIKFPLYSNFGISYVKLNFLDYAKQIPIGQARKRGRPSAIKFKPMKLNRPVKNKLNKIRTELFELLMTDLKITFKYEQRNDRRSSMYILEDICQLSKCYLDKDIDTYIVGMAKPETFLFLIKLN